MSLKKKVTKLTILEAAESEYLDFAIYYEKIQPGLGERFVSEFTDQLNFLINYPFAFQCRYRKFRVAFMAGFPCIIVYKLQRNEITVYAVRHNRRNPASLKKIK